MSDSSLDGDTHDRPVDIPVRRAAMSSADDAVRLALREVERSPQLVLLLGEVGRLGGRPYAVGGSVRDGFLGLAPMDLDIECHGIEHRVLADLLASHVSVIEVGMAFSVFKVKLDTGQEIDLSLPRSEAKTGPRHTDFAVRVDPFMGIERAAARRDFTINAMAIDLIDGVLIDPHGGRRDLANSVLRHTSGQFSEDPLRVLRAAQFAARFALSIDPETAQLSHSIMDQFEHIAVERVWGEFRKIFRQSAAPSRALDVLHQTGWIEHFPDLVAIAGVPQDPVWHPEGTVDVHSGLAADAAVRVAAKHGLTDDARELLVCAALVHDLGKATHTQIRDDGRITAYGHADAGVEPARRFLSSIGAPRDLIARVLPLVREHMCCASSQVPTAAAVRRLARRLESASINEWAWLVEADNQGRGEASQDGCAGPWLALAETEHVLERPVDSIVRGDHLIGRGLTPGPEFKVILTAALTAQENGEFDDEHTAIAWLDRYLAGARVNGPSSG